MDLPQGHWQVALLRPEKWPGTGLFGLGTKFLRPLVNLITHGEVGGFREKGSRFILEDLALN